MPSFCKMFAPVVFEGLEADRQLSAMDFDGYPSAMSLSTSSSEQVLGWCFGGGVPGGYALRRSWSATDLST
jgi:hypothetical protein